MKSIAEPTVSRLVVATGVSSVVTQLLTIRECLAQFDGNEFVIALILFNWLFLGGAGTLLARWTSRRLRPPSLHGLAGVGLALAALPTLQILALRLLRELWFLPGVSVGFYATWACTLAVMGPYTLLVGFALPFSLSALQAADRTYPAARIYILDSLGDVAGGVLFAFFLVSVTTPLWALCLVNLPLALCAFLAFARSARRRPGPVAGAAGVLVVLAAGILLEPRSLEPGPGRAELAAYRETRYGRVTVQREREQVTVFQDGVPLFGSRDVATAEEAVHYALAQRKRADTLLLVSTVGGMMAEIEKHRPRRVDYVELNPEVTRLQFRFGLIRRIPGLNVVHRDGRAYLAAADTLYNAILVNLPEPETFQLNRFFTTGFFDLAREKLAPGGVLSFAVRGYDNYLAEPQRQKISTLYHSAAGRFAHVRMLPGGRIYFLCSDRPISDDIPGLLDAKGIATTYLGRYYDGDVTRDRIRQIHELLDGDTPPNHDLSPRLMRIVWAQWFAKFGSSPRVFGAAAAALCLLCLFRASRRTFALFSTGFAVMGCEILVIFAFQIFFGYIYSQIGWIVTVFLAGLMPGAWVGHRLRAGGRRGLHRLAGGDLLLTVALGAYVLAVGKEGHPVPAVFFLVFGFVVSFLGGCQFPLALGLGGDDAASAATLFSADLAGAAFGTLVTSVVMIPYLGIIGSAAGLVLLKLLSLFVLVRGHETLQPA